MLASDELWCMKSKYVQHFKELKWEAYDSSFQELLLHYCLSWCIISLALVLEWLGPRQYFGQHHEDSSLPLDTSSLSVAQQEEEDAAVTPGKEEVPNEPGLSKVGGSVEARIFRSAGPLYRSEE